jgi:tRNA A-37 threonylcarbamoyl transferase component Bud32
MDERKESLTEKKCNNEYEDYFMEEEKILGEGTYGSVVSTCLRQPKTENEKCPYVTKIIKQKDHEDLQYFVNSFFLEAKLSKFAGVHNFGPETIDYYICNQGTEGRIVMEKWPRALDELNEDFYIDSNFFINVVFPKVKLMHDSKILHCDLFCKNIMVRELNGRSQCGIIDFGTSFLMNKMTPLLRAYDCVTLLFGNFYINPEQGAEVTNIWVNSMETGDELNDEINKIIDKIIDYIGEGNSEIGTKNLIKAFKHRVMYFDETDIEESMEIIKRWKDSEIAYSRPLLFYKNVLKNIDEGMLNKYKSSILDKMVWLYAENSQLLDEEKINFQNVLKTRLDYVKSIEEFL